MAPKIPFSRELRLQSGIFHSLMGVMTIGISGMRKLVTWDIRERWPSQRGPARACRELPHGDGVRQTRRAVVRLWDAAEKKACRGMCDRRVEQSEAQDVSGLHTSLDLTVV